MGFKGNYSIVKLIKLCLFALCVSSCSMGSPDSSEVKTIANQFYEARQQQDIDTALGFFSNNRLPEEWRLYLGHIAEKIGQVEHFEYKHLEVNTVLGGRFYIFEYQVGYSSGKNASEVITLFDTVEEDDRVGIVAYQITAEGYDPLF